MKPSASAGEIVLVTGSSGLIGSAVVRCLESASTVIGFDREGTRTRRHRPNACAWTWVATPVSRQDSSG